MFINYLKTAIRHLWRHKLFAVINIVGLAVGFAAFNLIVTFIRFELSFDEFHQHHERIYRVEQIRVHEGRQERDAGLPPPLAGALKAEFPEIEAVTQVLKAGELTLSVGDHRRISAAQCLYADASFFEVFSFTLMAGDRRTALDEPYSAVISERIARALFGDDNPMGQTIRVNHRFDFKVTGIHRKVPANSHLQFDLLISLATHFSRLTPESLSSWGDNWLPLYILLKKKHRGEDLNQKLRQALWTYPDLGIYDRQVYLRPLKDIHLHSHVLNELGINSDIRNVCIFGSVAVLILLIVLEINREKSKNRMLGV